MLHVSELVLVRGTWYVPVAVAGTAVGNLGAALRIGAWQSKLLF